VVFCGRVEAASLRERLESEGFLLAEPGPRPGDTVALLAGRGLVGCWVVLDGYHFGPEWQEELETAGFPVLCVDDGAKLPRYAARAILAPDHDASPAAYPAPAASVILAGSRYRLLRRGFADLHGRADRDVRNGARVLVAFGGADTRNVTAAALRGLEVALGPRDTALVVLGPVNPHRESVQQVLAGAGFRHELLQDVLDMAALYAQADLAVSAAGGAAWEMAAAGLPAVLVPVAPNQEPGTRALVQAGAAASLGGSESLGGQSFPALVRHLLDAPAARAAMARAGREASDGRGALRVCQVLEYLAGDPDATECVLRRAEPGDMEQVFRLANDPAVRSQSFSPEPIALADHARWFAARLASPDTAFFVLDLEGVVAALARFDRSGDAAEIDVAVHPAFRGRGLGARILREASPLAAAGLGVARLRGVVLEGNVGSRRCFARAGFAEAAPEQIKGKTCAVFVLESGAGEA
jgi:spore coat polysaccharide biosynthesis predicted glycosyltransferase SpsG/RimJ/RimL family protein N-acetyltransferase